MLLFVQNKERAKELYDELKLEDIRPDVIHSDLSQIQVTFTWLLYFLHQQKVHLPSKDKGKSGACLF